MAEQVKGLSIKLTLDSSELTSGLDRTQKQLKEQQRELRRIESAMKVDSSPIDGLNRKYQQLNKILGTLKERIDMQRQAVKLAQEQYDKGDGSLTRLEKEKDRLDRLTDSYDSYSASLGRTAAELERLNREQRNAKWDSLIDVGKKLSVVSASIVAAFTALTASVTGAAESIAEISEQAAEAGISAESFQRLTYAASLLGVKSETMSGSLRKVNSILGQIANGSGQSYAEALGKIGLSADELSEMDTEQAFLAIVDAMGKVTDSSELMGIATALFGEDLATKVLPFVEAGADALKEYGEEASTIGEEQIESAKRFQALWGNLKKEMLAVLAELLPSFNEALEGLLEIVKEDVAPALKSLIDGFNGLPDGVKKAIAAMAGIAAVAGPLTMAFGSLGKALSNVVSGLSGTIGASGGGGLLGLVAAHPAAAAAIASLTALFATAYATDEEFRESVEDLGSAIGGLATRIASGVAKIWNESLKPVWDSLSAVFAELMGKLIPVLSSLLEGLSEVLGKVMDALSPIVSLLAGTLGSLVERFAGWLSSVLDIVQALSPALGIVMDMVSPVIDLVTLLTNAIETLVSALKKAWDDSLIGKIVNGIAGFGEKIVDFFTGGDDGGNGGLPTGRSATRGSLPGSSSALPPSGGSDSRNYYVTINTTASHMSIDDIDRTLGENV